MVMLYNKYYQTKRAGGAIYFPCFVVTFFLCGRPSIPRRGALREGCDRCKNGGRGKDTAAAGAAPSTVPLTATGGEQTLSEKGPLIRRGGREPVRMREGVGRGGVGGGMKGRGRPAAVRCPTVIVIRVTWGSGGGCSRSRGGHASVQVLQLLLLALKLGWELPTPCRCRCRHGPCPTAVSPSATPPHG